jgi:hypothetical protein
VRTHGKWSTYNAGCYCTECRTVSAERARTRRDSGRPPVHGLSGYMNYHCKCEICRAAGSVWNAANYRARKSRLI